MTDHIYEPNEQFDFKQVIAKKPISQSGGNFLIKFEKNGIPLYIQTPKCTIKQRVDVKTNKKQYYCDLVFLQEHESFIQWMENLEGYSQQVIYNNKANWFETELELVDIENSFTSPMKSFKSGKSYIVRTNIPHSLGKTTLSIYDENENAIDFENITDTMQIITILEIQGIRCSTRSFQIEMEVKQMMVLKPVNIFEKCILKPKIGSVIKESMVNDFSLGKVSTTVEPISLVKENVEEPSFVPFIETSSAPSIEEEETHDETPLLDSLGITPEIEDPSLLKEVEFDLEKIGEDETVTLRQRKDVYYEMYKEARRKAKVARDLALSSYLEAKRIKNTYMLDDIIESDDDEDDDQDDDEDDDDEDEDEDNEGEDKAENGENEE